MTSSPAEATFSLADKILGYARQHPDATAADVIREMRLGLDPENPDVITKVLVEHCVSETAEETAKDWFEREVHFAIDAHDLTDSLQHDIEGVLYGPSFGNEPTEASYRQAAQLIACRRMTCGGPNLGHEHIS